MPYTAVDRQLVQRCLAQEPGAWREFVDRFAPLFYHVIQHTAHTRSVSLQSADGEDLCSEIFLRITEQDFAILRRFRGRASLSAYLTVIARRIVVRSLLQRRQAEALGHVPAHHENLNRTQSELQRIENQELVQQMLVGLTAREAEIVRLYHLEGKSYAEISQLTGVPENSIGPTLSRAREKLRLAHT
ncbi:MAG: RNA polymerase sigma factor [Planctomycetaceae bacterium]|nr:MAG: RNA polymerase sigma factor [Planctomycetaceae bacterium]